MPLKYFLFDLNKIQTYNIIKIIEKDIVNLQISLKQKKKFRFFLLTLDNINVFNINRLCEKY